MDLVSLAVLLLYFSLSPVASPESGDVNLGALITFDSIIGAVSKIAMKAAQDDINSEPSILGGRKLSLTMLDSKSSGFHGLIGALQFMETDTVAIIGPQDSVMAHVVSYLASDLHVPILSFAALDPALSPLQFPYFIQTAPSDMFQMAAIAEIVSYFGWAEVVAVYSDDDQSRNGVILLSDQLSSRGVKLLYKAALAPDPNAVRGDIERELVKILSMEPRIFVLHTFHHTGLLVFDVAKKLGMMDQGFVWIASSWLSTVLDSKSPLPVDVTVSIQGALTLRHHAPDTKLKRDFVNRWKKLSNGSIELNRYGLYAYDTVWLIARAVKLFFDEGNTISFSNHSSLTRQGSFDLNSLSVFDGGKQLLKSILQTNMTGLSGPLRFDSQRLVVNPAFDVINILESGFEKQIGYWSNCSGLSVAAPEKLYSLPPNRSVESSPHLSDVFWPGGATAKPRGWVFPGNGRRLRIGIPNRVSFKEFVSLVNGSNVPRGYVIDVFLAAIKLLPYAVPYEFIPFGDGHANPNYGELVKRVTSGEFDGIVGDIAIVTNRTKVVDFTQPFVESGLVVVAPLKTTITSPWSFLRPFTPLMWIVTAAFFLILGFVMWILEHRKNDEFRGPPKQQFVTIFWFSFSTMFFAQRENTLSTLGRFVLIIWMFVVLIITSSYTASLTSITTVEKLSSPVTGIEALITSNGRIGFQVGSFAESYLMQELGVARTRLLQLGSPDEYAAALSNGSVAAVVEEQPYVELFLSDHCQFSVRGHAFTKSGWGFAFPRHSPLAVDMSTAILSLSESGKLEKIRDKWVSRKAACSKSGEVNPNRLPLQSFWGLFVISGAVCVLAILIFTCRMVRQFSKRFPHESPDPAIRRSREPRSRRIQRFLSFVDEKAECSKLKRKWKDECSKECTNGELR